MLKFTQKPRGLEFSTQFLLFYLTSKEDAIGVKPDISGVGRIIQNRPTRMASLFSAMCPVSLTWTWTVLSENDAREIVYHTWGGLRVACTLTYNKKETWNANQN